MSAAQEVEVVEKPLPVRSDSAALTIASAREKLLRFLPRSIEIITELAETSENDRVRLAAAESIADRAGLGKSSTTQVQVSQTEHDVAEIESAELLARIQANQAVIDSPHPSLEAVIVHESD
jgi:hypothetical protein